MSAWIVEVITSAGYLGIFLLMVAENVFPPIPSELILPFAGYAVAEGNLGLAGVILAATAGALIGTLPWFYGARALGRHRLSRLAARHGRWLTVGPEDIDRANRWFARWGVTAIFLCRLVPGLRTLISAPAGLSDMPLLPFLAISAVGTVIWNGVLVGAGLLLHEHYDRVEGWIDPVSKAVLIGIVAVYLWRVATWRTRSVG